MSGPRKAQSTKRKATLRSVVIFLPLAAACAGKSPSNDLGPKNKFPCAEGQTGWVVVNSQLQSGVNIYAHDGLQSHFIGLVRPGRTTLQMPKGARRAYLGDLEGDQPIGNRTALSAAVTFDYRCE
jgi:hypothetical protein